jgi:O-antigen/teichoic acid export membrane protein
MPAALSLRPTFRRTGWTVVDQAVSSGTTLLVVAFLARRADEDGFGALSVLLAATVLTIGIARGLGTDALLVRHVGIPREQQREQARRAVGVNLLVGLVAGGALLMASALVAAPLRGALAVGAIAMPALTLQDAWRFVFVAEGRPKAAVLNDATWTVCFVAVLLLPWSSADLDVGWLAVMWASGGVVAAAVGFVQFRRRLRFDPVRWVAEHRGLSLRFVAEFVLLTGVAQLVMLAVARFQGLAASGSMRGAAFLVGPATVLASGVLMASVPEGARLRDSPRTAQRLLCWFALVATVVMVGSGVVMANLPTELGEMLLGEQFAASRALVLVTSVVSAGTTVVMIGAAGLRALGDAKRSLRLVASLAGALLVGGFVGARSGAFEANVGLAVPAWGGGVAALWILHRRVERFEAGSADSGLGGAPPADEVTAADSSLAAVGR